MKVNDIVRDVCDSIIYNQTYAFRYPTEDGTNLQSEFARIRERLSEVVANVKSPVRSQWFAIALREVDAAFQYYSDGNEPQGRRSLDAALDYLRNGKRGKPHRTDFIAAPEGTVSKTNTN